MVLLICILFLIMFAVVIFFYIRDKKRQGELKDVSSKTTSFKVIKVREDDGSKKLILLH